MTSERTSNNLQKNHKLCLEERSGLTVSAVERVENFSDSEIILSTVMGKLTIKGENLHIEKLNVDSGEFIATGKVSSMVYSKSSMNKGSLIERLFK